MSQATRDWADIAADGGRFDPAELARKAADFDRSIRRRNWREYLAAGAVAALNLYWAYHAQGAAERVAMLLIAAGALFAAFMIARLGTPTQPRTGQPTIEAMAEYRTELARQERLLTQVPRNYIAPFLPGFALMGLAPLIDGTAESTGAALIALLAFSVVIAVVLTVVVRVNANAARRLREMIAALDQPVES